MQEHFSSAGVTAFTDHDASGTSDTNVVNNCINFATTKILDYAGQQYVIDASFIAHATIRGWATYLACYRMCTLRGSDPPDSIAADYLETIELLKAVLANNYQLYGLAKRGGKAPAYANVTIDRRYPNRKIRVKPNASDVQAVPQVDGVVNPGTDY